MRTAILAGLLLAGAAAAGLVAGASGAPGADVRGAGRIFFASNRAPDLNPELFAIGRDGRGRRQLTPPTSSLVQASLSPDGTRAVGWTGRGLAIVDANGKHRRQLTTNSDDDEPVWSPDGTKIAFHESVMGLDVIDASGGTPRRLDSILPALLPAWSPDSSEVVYAISGPSGIEIRAARADGSSTRTVTTVPATSAFPLTRLQWAPGKQIVFSTRDGIYRLDPAGGAPVLLTHSVAYDPLVSPDGKRIAFEDRRDGDPEIWVMNADGSGQTRLSAPFYAAEAWAPDGTELAVLPSGSTPSGAAVQEQIYRLATDGSGAKVQVTHEPSGTAFQSEWWTPDGRRLYYTARLLSNDYELYSLRLDGSGLRQLTHDAIDEAGPAISPDGRRLAFERVTRGKAGLYLMRPGGGGVHGVPGTRAGDSQPAWSPDGKRLAFARGRGSSASIEVLDLRTRRVRRVAADGIAPAWSPTGSWIAFTSAGAVYAVHPNGRGLHRIPRLLGPPAWSPDGKELAGELGVAGQAWIGVESVTGRHRRLLARVSTGSRPAWRRDGRVVVYADGGNLYSVPADGSGRPRLVDRAPGVTADLSW